MQKKKRLPTKEKNRKGKQFDDSTKCQACCSDEGQDEADKWIEYNSCPRWYHKYCLNENYENMSLEEIDELNFNCNFCSSRVK